MSVSYADPERPNLYHYIRYASKLIKVRSELHKQEDDEEKKKTTRPIMSKQGDLKTMFQQEGLQQKFKQDLHDLDKNISYLSTLKKLNGLETNKSQNRMAILISLSPNVLSAANVARQRRKHSR